MYSIEIDSSKLNKQTTKVVMSADGIVEVDKNNQPLVTHHYPVSHVLWAIAPAVPVAAPYAYQQAPTPELVRYAKSNMKTLYDKLKKAASTGIGDVDAKAILDLLKKAEVTND